MNVYIEDTDKSLSEKLDPNTRYAFFKTLTKGGKSVIKSCKDLHLNRVVCYKTLRPEFADDDIEQRRLLREARVSAMLQHPNTIPVHEIGRDRQGRYYFTMKLVYGYTLREILDYRDRYDLTQMMDVIEQVGQALSYAHTHGVAHRDIKPENILVGPFGEVVLMDWGLAKVWSKDGSTTEEEIEQTEISDADDSMTGKGKLQGTVSYMSPEQIERDPDIGFSTDIYSLGCVLYEILAGQTPFTGELVHEVLDAIKSEIPAKPSQLTRIRVPRMLEEVSMACLGKEPKQRPKSMAAMMRSMQSWESSFRQY